MGERKGMKGLELWCRKVTEGYPGVQIHNMTTSWRDGLAFCAMIHHFRPDLIDFDKLNKEDVYHNNELAFRVAEHHLGIPALLEAEDMVEYEVPDRLSILTYLSQFYQTFEVARGKSGPRVVAKRTQSSPDHGIVSPASTSPPTKVAALTTASRVRREPCAKCKLPVFIAERLHIGKLLYHRTCFKCARCNSQLTLANYYETESGEFCCEVCPDEEVSQSSKGDENSVLHRSLSDEEKSASLRNQSEDPDAYSSQFESALEFSTDAELKKSFTLSQTDSKARLSFFQSQIEAKNKMDDASLSSTDSGNEEVPPDLPSSKPPEKVAESPILDDGDEINSTYNIKNDSYSSFSNRSSSKNNNSDSFSVNKDKNFVTKDLDSPSSSVKARLKLFENLDSKQKSEKVPLGKSRYSPEKSAKVVNLSDLEDFDNISKKETDSDGVSINSEGKSVQKSDSASKFPSEAYKYTKSNIENNKIDNKTSAAENQATKRFSSSKRIELKISACNDASSDSQNVNTDISNVSNISSLVFLDSSVADSVFTTESDSGHISSDRDPSVIEILDSTQESKLSEDEDLVKINVEPPSPIVTLSDDSYLSAKEIVSTFESTAVTQGFTTAREIFPSSEPTDTSSENVVETSNFNVVSGQEILKNVQDTLEKDLKEIEPSETFDLEANSVEIDVIIRQTETFLEETDLSFTESNKITDAKNEFIKKTEDIKETEDKLEESTEDVPKETNTPKKSNDIKYPEDMNPFGEVEEEEDGPSEPSKSSLNPFGEDTDEEELLPKIQTPMAATRKKKIIMPREREDIYGTPECLQRIYTQKISINPFETDDQSEEEEEKSSRRKIIPLHRPTLNPFESEEEEEEGGQEDQKIVPVPKPRHFRTSSGVTANSLSPSQNHALSPSSKSSHGGSTSSISSGSVFGSARKKKPAPRPPLPSFASTGGADRNNLPGSATPSVASLSCSPSQSLVHSPVSIRSHGKAKRAPPPPPNASTPFVANQNRLQPNDRLSLTGISPIVYGNTGEGNIEDDRSFDSQNFAGYVETEKIVKDEENRNRQSFDNKESAYKFDTTEIDRIINNKSTHGKWKRQKGKAPSRPIPERRMIKSLPLSEIRRELDTIEIQQQGLEKQGVRLEEIIRERCEGSGDGVSPDDILPIDVEDQILQLFELVNEKNELFRRQAELMYLKRQQRLEEEHADVEYQIRCLMMQPEANKTDSDKTREEALINRLVEIVERRNEIIECLEMDRKRETEEDDSISHELNLYSLKRENDKEPSETEKKHKKDRIKLKKIKMPFHLHKHKEKGHKVELDKDVDTTEVNTGTLDKKKKKKFNLF